MSIRTSLTLSGLATLLLLSACGQQKSGPPPTPPAPLVTVETVKSTKAEYFDEYPATVTALNQVELRPQVNGFITGVHFKDGARIRKGQLLYTIDDQLYAANYQQASANVQLQQANLNKAKKDVDRYHDLEKEDAIAKQLVDNAEAALEVAQKQVAAATANLQAVQTNVKYTKVYAPFEGVIGISSVKTGAAVTAGQTVLNTISSDQELAVDFNVDQKEIYRFTTLLNEQPKANDSTFSLAFGNDVYPYPGKIALLDRTVNPQTGSIKARLVFPNKKNLLISGMNGTVRVKNNSAKNVVLIPNKAVTEQLGEFFVYIAEDSSRVSQRKVILGKILGPNIMVKDGLADGDKIVVEGVQNLREGATIRTAPAQGQNR